MKEERLRSVLLVTGSALLVAVCLSPFIWMIVVSLSESPDFLLPQASFSCTFRNFISILTNESVHLKDYLLNSIIVSVVSAFFATLFASLSAYAITRFNFPGKLTIPVLVLAFSMLPQISIAGYLFRMMTELRLINTYYALILPDITMSLPLALWIMLSYFSQLSTELDKAALVDGASRLQIFFRIILPVALPGIFSTLLLVFIYSFNEFLFALMFTIDYNARTIPVGIALFEGIYGQIPWGEIMAGAVVATVPVIIPAVIFQRYIIQGLTRGAVKE